MAAFVSVSVSPARVLKLLAGIIVVLLILSLIGQYARFVLGHGRLLGFVPEFDVDEENNIPTYVSMLMLLGASGGLAVIAQWVRTTGRPFQRHWWGLAGLFAYLSVDEMASLHERLADLPFLPETTGLFHYAWVIPGMLLVALFAVAYLRFFWHLPARWKGLFAGAAVLFVGGALGIEMLGGLYASLHGELHFGHALILTAEEGFELFGVALFVYAVLDYLQAHGIALQVRVGPADGGEVADDAGHVSVVNQASASRP
jgi:hypothetical protein